MEEENLIVPGEFMAGEAASEPPPPVDIVPPAPMITGPRPKGGDAGMSYRGMLRSSGPEGALSEAADISVARSAPAPAFDQTERQRLEEASRSDNPVEAGRAARALRRKDAPVLDAPTRRQNALDSIIEQSIYDDSESFKTISGTASSFAGAVSSLTNFGGLAGLLVRQFPALASRPIATSALDAALTNTLTDPVVQGIRTLSGGQEDYSLLQTALAPVIGGAFGGSLAGAGQIAGRAADRYNFNAAFDPRITPEEQAVDLRIARERMLADNAQLRQTTEPPIGGSSPVNPQPRQGMQGEVGAPLAEPYSPLAVETRAQANEPAMAPEPPTFGRPGLVAQGLETADGVKKQWRVETPYDDLDAMLAAATGNQKSIGDAGRQIAEEFDVEFRDPGVKANRERILQKMGDKKPGTLTDIVRSGFDVKTPEQADAIIDRLAQQFEVIDEGWFTTVGGYFDRKVYVRFPDGMIGEVQMWPPGLFKAKEFDGGHKLYEEARVLAPEDPRVGELNRQMEELYAPVLASLPDAWKAVFGNGGNSGNLAANASGVTGRAAMPTSAELTLRQAPPSSNTQASPGVQNAASPSNTQGLGAGASTTDITSAPNIAPAGAENNTSPSGQRGGLSQAVEADPLAQDVRATVEKAISQPSAIAEFGDVPPTPGRPAGIFMFDAVQLKVDANRFQFKTQGDEEGVTNALKAVTKWDPAKANQVIVWQAKNGDLYVADGHQRTGLARRLVKEGREERITLPGLLYREADGFTAEDVRAHAAAKNIAEGSGTPVDGAKVLRSRPDLVDGSMPVTRTEARQAFELARLDDESFRMIVNDVIDYRYGAVVGRNIPNDGPRQQAAIKAIAKFEPRNETEATVLVRRVADAELAKAEGSTGSLFGDMDGADSTAGEEMRIVARAVQELKKDKALLSRVVANADRIEQTGSSIARDAAKSVVDEADVFAKTILSNAYSAGPVREALRTVARELKDGTKDLNQAARELVAAVRGQIEVDVRGGPGARGGAGARLAEEPGAEGLPQTLIPGVEPVTDRQRLDLEINRSLSGGNQSPPAGGLFDDDARQQDNLFRRRGGQAVAQQPLPNQTAFGRPIADQGTPVADAAVQRLEQIGKTLVDGFDAIARVGRVTGGAEGVYKTRSGVVRVRQPSDINTLAHEVGHSFHLQSPDKPQLDAIVRSNVNELQQFGAGQGREGNAEAFANLFHAYVTNYPFAQMNYPNATASLDNLMRTRFPDQMKVIEEVRAALDVIHRAPSVDVVRADQITTQPPKFGDRFRELVSGDKDPQGRVVYSALDSLYTQSVDSNHPVYKAVQNLVTVAGANGKQIDLKPVDDAYLLARRLPGSHGRADAMLKHGVIPAGKVSPEGPSLSSGIEKALGKKWDAAQFENFGAYLTARRMVAEYERFFAGLLERPPGKLSAADYRKAVADFEAANPSFAAGADDIYAFQRNYLKRQFDKGLITREYYEESMKRQDYVPAMRDLRNFEDGDPNVPGTSMGGNGLLSRTIMKRFRGSDRPVINPLESIFKKVHDIEFAIARNDTINALARLSNEAGPGAGFIYEDIPSNQLRGQRVDVMEALKSAGKTAGIDEADMTQLLLQAEDVLGDSTWATIFRQEPIREGAEPIVYRWVNGERRAGRLGDDRFARELYHALTSMSDYEKDFLTTVLAMASGILRTGITKSPDFILTNAVRDQSTAMLTAGRRYIPFASMAKGLVEAIKKTDDAIEFAGQGGLAGGAIVEAISSSNFGRNVKALQGGNWFGEVLKAFELSETGTRIGLYKSYLEQAKAMGFDAENAALYAAFKADDYIDFRKHGASMGVPRRIFTFLNAAIQGTDREVRAAADWPVLEAKRARGETLSSTEMDRLKDARIGVLRLATMGVVLGAGLAFLNSENEKVQNAGKYNRANNFLFTVNGQDFALPKGFGVVQSVVNLFERGAEYAMRGDPTLATEWLEGMAKAFMLPASNPALTLAYDLPANYDRFRDRNIVPYYMQGWDATEQYSKYTSSMARQLSKAADLVGIKLSPMKIDYTIQQLGGGMARDVLFGWDVLMGSDRPEKQIYDYPVLRRFVKNLERGSKAAEAFYQLVGEKTGSYEQAENAFRGKITNGERAGAAEYLRNLKDDERAWVTLNTLGFDTKSKQMHPMMNARERVSLANGMVRQLVNGNVIKEEDLDRRDLTRSRRDAEPIALNPRERAQLQEEFLEYANATARNGMVAVGAKGTTGLKQMDTAPILERIRMISPAVADEFAARVDGKNLPSFESAVTAWPEMKRRLLTDGESADIDSLVPADVARRAKRRR